MMEAPLFVSGYDPLLVEIIESLKSPIASITLYVRNISVEIRFDIPPQVWQKQMSETGDAGLWIKCGDKTNIICEIDPTNGLRWEHRSDYRFKVDPFENVMTIRGPIQPNVIVEYMNRSKFRLYAEDGAVRPRDFAIDMVDFVLRDDKKLQVDDFKETLIDRYLARQGKAFPPPTKAPMKDAKLIG